MNPPSEGSTIELTFALPTGLVRALAIVRRSKPGQGMGVQFIQMSPENRARLNQYLSLPEAFEKSSGVAPANSDSANSQLAISLPGDKAVQLRFEMEVMHLVELTGKGTYYQLLGVTSESPRSQLKSSYYSLARKFHPDSHTGTPS